MNSGAFSRLVVFVVAIPVALVLIWFTYGAYVDWRYVTPWQQVARRDTEHHVITLVGQPQRITAEHMSRVAWESEHTIDWYNADCVKQFHYIPVSITGEEYDVGFDSSGRVVSKFHVTSP